MTTPTKPAFKNGKLVLPPVEPKFPGADCENCPLAHKKSTSPATIADSDKAAESPRIVIVGESPGANELGREAFIGDSGQILRDAIRRHDLQRYGVRLENAIMCDPRKIKANDSEPSDVKAEKRQKLNDAVSACSDRLKQSLDAANPDLVILLGGEAKKAVTPENKTKITDLSGTFYSPPESSPYHGYTFLYTFHPAFMLHSQNGDRLYPTFFDHIGRANSYFSPKAFDPTIKIANTPNEALAFLEELEPSELVALDAETTTLSPWADGVGYNPAATPEQERLAAENGYTLQSGKPFRKGTMLSLQLSGDGETGYVFTSGVFDSKSCNSIISRILNFLSRRKIVCHNAQFDMRWIAKYFGYLPFSEDTMLMSYSMDETPFHSLKRLATKHLQIEDWSAPLDIWRSGLDMEDKDVSFANVPPELLYRYAGLDAIITRRLYNVLYDLQDEHDKRIYRDFLVPVSNMFIRTSVRGATVDIKELTDAWRQLEREEKQFAALLKDRYDVDNANSQKQIHEALERPVSHRGFGIKIPLDPVTQKKVGTGTAGRSTGWFTSLMKKGDPSQFDSKTWQLSEFVKAVSRKRSASKAKDTYLTDLANSFSFSDVEFHNNRAFGVLHPDAKIWVQVTGRVSFQEPTITNFPAHTDHKNVIRNPVKPRPGFKWIHGDFKQFEYRIYAAVTGDKGMEKALTQPGPNGEKPDPHTFVGTTIWGDEYEELNRLNHGRYRTICKECGFGRLFNRGVVAIARQLEIPIEEAEGVCNVIDGLFPDIDRYREWITEQLQKHQRIINPMGRSRRFPVINDDNWDRVFNQGVNCYIQGTASDCNHMGVKDASEAYPEDFFPFWTTHDSFDGEISERLASDAVEFPRFLEILETAHKPFIERIKANGEVPFDCNVDLPMSVDYEIMEQWAA